MSSVWHVTESQLRHVGIRDSRSATQAFEDSRLRSLPASQDQANVTCIASTPAPARKRRRPNQDLQERLARCEELLKLYADGAAPGQAQTAAETATPTVNETLVSERAESAPPAADKLNNFKPACRMVNDDGSVRFMDSHIWATIYEELQAMRDIVETEDPEDTSILGSSDLSPGNDADLLCSGHLSTANIEDLVPEPVHALKLWQLFLDRVNPLFKVVHVPSIQPVVLEGAMNMMSMPHNQQALLFSIYSTASLSMSESESVQVLGMTREAAVQSFLAGTKIALVRSNFLKNYNMTVLQALVHFMHALQDRCDRHAAWVLTGTLVRIAQKMGYHRDGESLGLDMYETEMRRRIWWQIMIQDSKYAMLSGLNHSPPTLHWDSKMPSNVNDADLFPGSTASVQARDGPTEMAFVLILNEIYKFKLQAEENDDNSAFEAALLGLDIGPDEEASNSMLQKFRDHFRELEVRLAELEDKFIDVKAGNVHKAAQGVRHIFMGSLADMMVPLRQHPEYGTEIFGPKDILFKIFVLASEQRLRQYEAMGECGFLWFAKSYFQLDVFAVMMGQLCQKPTGGLADRAWITVQQVYCYHDELYDMSSKQSVTQAQITLKAWKVREQYHMQHGRHLETPGYILRLRELLPSADSRSSVCQQSNGDTPTTFNQNDAQAQPCSSSFQLEMHISQQQQQQQHQQQQQQQQQQPKSTSQFRHQVLQGAGGMDPFLGDVLDMSSMNWDVLGDVMNPNDQLSLDMFGYGGYPLVDHGVTGNGHTGGGHFQQAPGNHLHDRQC
ncbi:hypothetical protein E4U33_001106 [Claviceps sp. LM78 group G4]|nr:hypothetical protein E4U33_001106 [Claviceps sp. LM78 group G4]